MARPTTKSRSHNDLVFAIKTFMPHRFFFLPTRLVLYESQVPNEREPWWISNIHTTTVTSVTNVLFQLWNGMQGRGWEYRLFVGHSDILGHQVGQFLLWYRSSLCGSNSKFKHILDRIGSVLLIDRCKTRSIILFTNLAALILDRNPRFGHKVPPE